MKRWLKKKRSQVIYCLEENADGSADGSADTLVNLGKRQLDVSKPKEKDHLKKTKKR